MSSDNGKSDGDKPKTNEKPVIEGPPTRAEYEESQSVKASSNEQTPSSDTTKNNANKAADEAEAQGNAEEAPLDDMSGEAEAAAKQEFNEKNGIKTEKPSHANKFDANKLKEPLKADMATFGEGENAAKSAMEKLFSADRITKMQEHIGEIVDAGAKDGATADTVKAEVAKLQTYVETLAKDDVLFKDVNAEGRKGLIERFTKTVRGALEEGEGKGAGVLGAEADKALKVDTLVASISEKIGSSKNFASKYIERGSSMFKGLNPTTGEAVGAMRGKGGVVFGTVLATGLGARGALNVKQAFTGRDDTDTGEHIEGGAGQGLVGIGQIGVGVAGGLLAATGRWR